MQTLFINKPEKERDITENLFEKYLPKKKVKTPNSPESEIREKILNLLNSKPNPDYPPLTWSRLCGLTKGWTTEEMYREYKKAMDWQVNSIALMKKLIKEKNKKIKEQLKDAEIKTKSLK